MTYRSPLSEQLFLLGHVVGYDRLAAGGHFPEAGAEEAAAILEAAARLCDTELAPLNRAGDLHPARLENGVLRSTPGFAGAYARIAEGGWIGLAAKPDHGGMGLPFTLASAVNEMMAGANLALQLNPLLTQGHIEALEHHAPDWIKAEVLPQLTSGAWSGTMNLTEPQAGSDVGALTTRAEPADDGSYRITGQKIFITWGDCDFVENVSHLVLARLPGAAPGTRGISLFYVPKILKDGTSNNLRVVSLEHKLGIHGSPTAVMSFEGAKGWLVGAENGGMAAMFTMMNNARLGVATQGVGVAEAAYQQALDYAQDRRQLGAAIIEHADVRRMLATMKAEILTARAIMLACALAIDMAKTTGDAGWIARAGLLTPIAKAFGTDTGHDMAQLGVQIHGGMGYIEETGAAQFARDVRITQIYEGTNGIQAMDLVGRKLSDNGEAAGRLIDEVVATAAAAREGGLAELAEPVWQAAESLREATEILLTRTVAERGAGAAAYLRAFARVLGGQAHLAAAKADPGRRALAAFYIRRLLPEVSGLIAQVRDGADTVTGLSLADLLA